MIRLVVADDHPIVLGGLVEVFSTEPDLAIIGTASNGDEALEAVRRLRPDILLLDLRMPLKDGLAVLREMRAESCPTRVVVLTAENNDDAVDAVLLGAQGIVLKSMPLRLMVKCIREVHAGRQWLERDVLARSLRALQRKERQVVAVDARLTARQLEIARMVAEGLPSKAIARKLAITEGTTKLHLHNIYEKLKLSGRLELVRYMRDSG